MTPSEALAELRAAGYEHAQIHARLLSDVADAGITVDASELTDAQLYDMLAEHAGDIAVERDQAIEARRRTLEEIDRRAEGLAGDRLRIEMTRADRTALALAAAEDRIRGLQQRLDSNARLLADAEAKLERECAVSERLVTEGRKLAGRVVELETALAEQMDAMRDAEAEIDRLRDLSLKTEAA